MTSNLKIQEENLNALSERQFKRLLNEILKELIEQEMLEQERMKRSELVKQILQAYLGKECNFDNLEVRSIHDTFSWDPRIDPLSRDELSDLIYNKIWYNVMR